MAIAAPLFFPLGCGNVSHRDSDSPSSKEQKTEDAIGRQQNPVNGVDSGAGDSGRTDSGGDGSNDGADTASDDGATADGTDGTPVGSTDGSQTDTTRCASFDDERPLGPDNQPTPPFGGPSDLTATVTAATVVTLTWPNDAKVCYSYRGYTLERSVGNTTSFTRVMDFIDGGEDTFSWVDDQLSPNTAYYYRVKSWNAGGLSAPVLADMVTTPKEPPIGVYALAAAAQSETEIGVTWSIAATDLDGFWIRVSHVSGLDVQELFTDTVADPALRQYQVTGLKANSGYRIEVASYNSGGNSKIGRVSATTYPGIATPVTNIIATPDPITGYQCMYLEWTADPHPLTSTRIERSTDGVTYLEVGGAFNTKYRDCADGLMRNRTYYYRMYRLNISGQSAYTESGPILNK